MSLLILSLWFNSNHIWQRIILSQNNVWLWYCYCSCFPISCQIIRHMSCSRNRTLPLDILTNKLSLEVFICCHSMFFSAQISVYIPSVLGCKHDRFLGTCEILICDFYWGNPFAFGIRKIIYIHIYLVELLYNKSSQNALLVLISWTVSHNVCLTYIHT